MKTNITCVLLLFTFVLTGSLQFTSGQTHTVNYNIPSWNNASGSFTFQTGTSENPITKKIEGYIRIISNNDEVIEINPQVIDSFIQIIENNFMADSERNEYIKNYEEKEKTVNKLKELKLLLEDQKRMDELITKLQSNSDISGLNWDYTVQTIRGFQALITGTVD